MKNELIEENVRYVFQDTRDNKVIQGYANEGIFVYWEVDPTYWEPLEETNEEVKKYYMANYQLLERINNGGLKQLN